MCSTKTCRHWKHQRFQKCLRDWNQRSIDGSHVSRFHSERIQARPVVVGSQKSDGKNVLVSQATPTTTTSSCTPIKRTWARITGVSAYQRLRGMAWVVERSNVKYKWRGVKQDAKTWKHETRNTGDQYKVIINTRDKHELRIKTLRRTQFIASDKVTWSDCIPIRRNAS